MPLEKSADTRSNRRILQRRLAEPVSYENSMENMKLQKAVHDADPSGSWHSGRRFPTRCDGQSWRYSKRQSWKIAAHIATCGRLLVPT